MRIIKKSYYLSLVFLFVFSSLFMGAIPPVERAALISLYTATNGDNWVFNNNWKIPPLHTDGFALPGTEGNWAGVVVNGDHVTELQLNGNEVDGSIPTELGNLSQLQALNLSASPRNHLLPRYNHITGAIPSSLGNLINLQSFDLSENPVNGSIPPELGNLVNLQTLKLYQTNLSGSIPPEIGNLSNLQTLYLYDSDLSGSIPSSLGNLTKLQILYLSSNRFSGSIPSQLGNLSNLRYLNLMGNQLSGSIPPELGNLGKLENIDLRHNQLSGSIPSELGNLSNLGQLNLSYNRFSGSIPSSLGNLSKLTWLELIFNNLTGSIPPQLGSLRRVWQFLLSNNQLSGSIPSELGTLNSAGVIALNTNQLSGEVPSSFTNMNTPILDIGYNCLRSTNSTVRAWLNLHDPDWESHQSRCGTPGFAELRINRMELNFCALTSVTAMSSQDFWITNTGGGTLKWNINSNADWLTCIPLSGNGDGIVTVSVNPSGLPEGSHVGTITIIDVNAGNTPQYVTITLKVKPGSEDIPPFGDFSTPGDGETVRSSVPVTGWALDDVEIQEVKIYREEGPSLVYIGDAVFVEGARPDVETAYPDYPYNYKAGWGYMLLTTSLPNGGNGVFKFHVIAEDKKGNKSTLGIKTITVDNAHAVKPFGYIDTPKSGGAASGKKYVNFGWALTPQPNYIPSNGSTIYVWVDGNNIGHPVYNIYREDIASLYPGYANKNGAVGYLFLDTTALKNGIHTIHWTATDNAGNTDGIGSRYFAVQNTTTDAAPLSHICSMSNEETNDRLPGFEFVLVKKGYSDKIKPEPVFPDENGIINIEIKQLERVEIHLHAEKAFNVVGRSLRELPVGSTFDKERAVFIWQPGPGFVGTYHFVFDEKEIIINIVPGFE